MKEIWKDVECYEGLYQVSNLGRVKSLSKFHRTGAEGGYYTKERMLSIRISNHGYAMVSLWKNNRQFNASVHRLIAEAFIENPENKPCINHKDGNKINNQIDNLEWCTYSENLVHAYETGLNDKSKHARTGKRRPLTKEEKDLISVKTKEGMKRAEVKAKLAKPRKKVK